MFRAKTILFILNLPLSLELSAPTYFLRLHLDAGFWEAFKPRLFPMPTNLLGVSIGVSPHFLWRCKLHFNRNYCISSLHGKLGLHHTHHCLQIFIRQLPIFIRGNRCHQFGPVSFSSLFEVNIGTFIFRDNSSCTLTKQFTERGANRL